MAESLIAAARAVLKLLDSFGPDHEQDDDEFISARAELRAAIEDAEGGG